MHLHLASSRAEAEWAMSTHDCGAAEYVDRLGILDDRVLAAHCVHLSEGEVALLTRRGVPVSHNPASNAILGYGIFPLVQFLAAGGLVGLLGAHAPQRKLPFVGRMLEEIDPHDRVYLEHLAFGVALAVLYGSSEPSNGIVSDEDDDE